jgi:type VI protein secretion system component Hcp
MRTIILLLLFSPLFSLAQKTTVFIKLTDARGQQIRGEGMEKGMERWIGATSISSAGKNSTQLSFTMVVNGASADLKRALSTGEFLLNGQVSVLAPNQASGIPALSYSIKMERIAVTACYEAMGCNNIMNTTVSLQATRIGWTYYNINGAGGAQTVSRKFGWDAEKQAEWTGF